EPRPNGIGAVRVYAVGPLKTREQVTRFDPGRDFGYHILSGFPVKDYDAVVTLDKSRGGTEICWRVEFDGNPRGTGWLMRVALVPYLTFLARKSGRVAERRADSGGW